MADCLRVMLEIGPKGKKVVAWAPDWAGLERGAKTLGAAVERLESYVPRYATIAKLAGLDVEFESNVGVEVVDSYPGNSSTDFWGISFAISELDREALSSEELERELSLMRAAWAFFDIVRSRVSAEMQKGPRGGGRDREQIVRHTLGTERQWARTKLGVSTPEGAMLTDEGLNTHREAYCAAIREYHAHDKSARAWPLRYLIRHTAYHTLDHAWEMEDKDLTEKGDQ